MSTQHIRNLIDYNNVTPMIADLPVADQIVILHSNPMRPIHHSMSRFIYIQSMIAELYAYAYVETSTIRPKLLINWMGINSMERYTISPTNLRRLKGLLLTTGSVIECYGIALPNAMNGSLLADKFCWLNDELEKLTPLLEALHNSHDFVYNQQQNIGIDSNERFTLARNQIQESNNQIDTNLVKVEVNEQNHNQVFGISQIEEETKIPENSTENNNFQNPYMYQGLTDEEILRILAPEKKKSGAIRMNPQPRIQEPEEETTPNTIRLNPNPVIEEKMEEERKTRRTRRNTQPRIQEIEEEEKEIPTQPKKKSKKINLTAPPEDLSHLSNNNIITTNTKDTNTPVFEITKKRNRNVIDLDLDDIEEMFENAREGLKELENMKKEMNAYKNRWTEERKAKMEKKKLLKQQKKEKEEKLKRELIEREAKLAQDAFERTKKEMEDKANAERLRRERIQREIDEREARRQERERFMSQETRCAVCLENDLELLNVQNHQECYHRFCMPCIDNCIRNGYIAFVCPLCRVRIYPPFIYLDKFNNRFYP